MRVKVLFQVLALERYLGMSMHVQGLVLVEGCVEAQQDLSRAHIGSLGCMGHYGIEGCILDRDLDNSKADYWGGMDGGTWRDSIGEIHGYALDNGCTPDGV